MLFVFEVYVSYFLNYYQIMRCKIYLPGDAFHFFVIAILAEVISRYDADVAEVALHDFGYLIDGCAAILLLARGEEVHAVYLA